MSVNCKNEKDKLNEIKLTLNSVLQRYNKITYQHELDALNKDENFKKMHCELTFDMYRFLHISLCKRTSQYECSCNKKIDSESSDSDPYISAFDRYH